MIGERGGGEERGQEKGGGKGGGERTRRAEPFLGFGDDWLTGCWGSLQVKHFKLRRVMEHNRKQTLEKLAREGARPMPEGRALLGDRGKPPS